MRKVILGMALIFFSIQTGMAAEDMMSETKPCGVIAKACVKAGYARKDKEMKFWSDCMKPVIMGQSVKGVTVDADTVKSCRTDKISALKQELSDFEGVTQ